MTVHHFNPQSVHSSTQLSRIFVPKVHTLWHIFIPCLFCLYGVNLADEIPKKKKKKNQPDKMRKLFFWVSPLTANSNDATCALLFFISLIMLCVLYPFTPIFIKLSVSVYSTYEPPRCAALHCSGETVWACGRVSCCLQGHVWCRPDGWCSLLISLPLYALRLHLFSLQSERNVSIRSYRRTTDRLKIKHWAGNITWHCILLMSGHIYVCVMFLQSLMSGWNMK